MEEVCGTNAEMVVAMARATYEGWSIGMSERVIEFFGPNELHFVWNWVDATSMWCLQASGVLA